MSSRFTNRTRLQALVAATAVALTLLAPCSHAWWDCGHHVIASIAFDKLKPEERKRFLDLLQHHPRYAEDFVLPESLKDDEHAANRWRFGAAAYWPDVARKFPTLSRPKWHYQLGATLAIGGADSMNVPAAPGPLPPKATLATQDLHIEQAVLICRKALVDSKLSKSERAIALCWLLHLYGDGHQPCHAGSLYTAETFPEGDRGANGIRIKDSMSVHAIWDAKLGEESTPDEIRKRTLEISSDWELMLFALEKSKSTHPKAWLHESRELAKRYVYPVEILALLPSAEKNDRGSVELPSLSEKYHADAARIARQQAAVAGTRLHQALKQLALLMP